VDLQLKVFLRMTIGNVPKLNSNRCAGSQEISVSIVKGYRLDNWGSIPGTSKDFSLLRSIQTDSGIHPASYPISSGCSFPRDKTART
jgi:hypothetical protein